MNFQLLVARFFLWIFELLQYLLPVSFRRDYGEELLLVFRDLLKETEGHGWFRTAAVALWSLCDLAHTALREHGLAFLNRHNLRIRKCTPRAQAALAFAGQEAMRLGSQQCGDEHILLGLLREGGGVAAIALQRLGIEADRVRSEIERCHRTRPQRLAPAGRRPEVSASARAQAVGLGHAFVGTEHVLLGILVNPQHSLEAVVESLGLSCDQVRSETLAVLTQAPNPLPTYVQRGGGTMAPAKKATLLAAMLLILLTASWLLVQSWGQLIPQNNAAQDVGVPGEQNQAGIAKSRKTAEQAKYHIEEVQIPLRATRSLKGTIVVPIAAQQVPAMLVIPGYGRNDGEVLLRADAPEEAGVQLGRYLAEHGIAVLRVTFGSGPTGNEPDLSVSELADRALQCVDYLKGRSEIDPKRIGIFGHSAGGGVAMLAASRSSELVFLVTAASPVESAESTVFAMLDGVLRAGGATEADRTTARNLQQHIFDSLAKGAKPEELRPDLQKLFRKVYAQFPKNHPALAGKDPEDEIKNIAERQLKTLTSPWFRGLLSFDPAAALAKIRCPALILFAEKDPKIDPRKSRELAKLALEKTGQQGSDVQVIPKADHSFEIRTASAASTDRQAHERFSPEFLGVLSSWLVERNGEDSPEQSQIDKFLHDNVDKTNVAMVIGLVDEHGSRIFSAGKLDNGTDQKADGDTVFAIGSNTKTFDVLLLEDMVERGEMRLDDPVSKYLPRSVKMPSHGGRQITLLDLATHTSGLPIDADDFTGAAWREHFDNYRVEKLYAWLSSHTLRREPGTQYAYSNAGMALLAHVIALKAGKDYESLVVDRICRPLQMDSTGIALTPEQRAHLAVGHDKSGKPEPLWDIGAYAGAGALRSTANDLLKYVAANAGLSKSSLTPLMEKTQVIRHKNSPGVGGAGDLHGNTAMAWMDFGIYQPPGRELLAHGGGISGYSTFIGFDKKHRRGVVVLASQRGGPDGLQPIMIGCALLQGRPLTRETATMLVLDLVGIGAALDLDEKTHSLRITKILPKSPASLAGLSAGLVIQRIDDVATAGKTLAECVALLRGLEGTKVKLEVADPLQNKTQTIEITRQRRPEKGVGSLFLDRARPVG